MPYRAIDLTQVVATPPAGERHRLDLEDLIRPDDAAPACDEPQLGELAGCIAQARRAARPVIWMVGGDVVNSGLSRLVIDLLRRGIITHVAGDGSLAVHDVGLALSGQTGGDAGAPLGDRGLGVPEETGAALHRAIRQAVRDGLGCGEGVGRFISEGEGFQHPEESILYQGYLLGVPVTLHVALAAEALAGHRECDFAALGWASGQDFRIYCAAVAGLAGGVHLTCGSPTMASELFGNALSIVRNLGHAVEHFTTGCLASAGSRRDCAHGVPRDDPCESRGSFGHRRQRLLPAGRVEYHVGCGLRTALPDLHHRLVAELGDEIRPGPVERPPQTVEQALALLAERSMGAARALRDLLARCPALGQVAPDLARAYLEISQSQRVGGTLFLAGNGGSMADALHVSGELLKSYKRPRPLPPSLIRQLARQPSGEILARNLDGGLRAVVLGVNTALSSAVANDNAERCMGFAQELLSLARTGDVLLGISTSGRAQNVRHAASVARARSLTTIALTGAEGGPLARQADIALRVPAHETDRVQEQHVLVYHCLCEMLEEGFFGEAT